MKTNPITESFPSLEILFHDDSLVAVNKPAGMLVHRTSIADADAVVVLQLLRQQLGVRLYPIHRLDRPTSGVLFFALSSSVAAAMQPLLTDGSVRKEYIAFVRGWMAEPLSLHHPVKTDKGKLVAAHTSFEPLRQVEYPVATDRYPSARYTLVRCMPHTGRWHQLRQHLAHLRHYIVNDRVHGDGKQNRLMSDYLRTPMLFLHARRVHFQHPVTHLPIVVTAPFPDWWHGVIAGDE